MSISDELMATRPGTIRLQPDPHQLVVSLVSRHHSHGPRYSLHNAPLALRLWPTLGVVLLALLMSSPLLVAPIVYHDRHFFTVSLPISLSIALYTALLANLKDIGIEVKSRQHIPHTTVRIATHEIHIDHQGKSTTFSLDLIEHIAVDRTGVRLRIDGQMHPLIPHRTLAEQQWLGRVVRHIWQQRMAHSEQRTDQQSTLSALTKTI